MPSDKPDNPYALYVGQALLGNYVRPRHRPLVGVLVKATIRTASYLFASHTAGLRSGKRGDANYVDDCVFKIREK